MPRLPRLNIEGVLYYVTCRGAHEQKLFEQRRDFEMYLELLKKYRQEYKFRLYAYVLLDQHIHLLVEPRESVTISDIIHVINSSYSKYFNSTYRRKGHLFRERFKACLVEKETYLVRLTSHIHLNPKRIGLVDDPKDYSYSSLPIYMGSNQSFEEEVQEVFRSIGQEPYSEYLRRFALKESPELHKTLQRKAILGSKDFVQKIRDLIRKEQERKGVSLSVKKIFFLGALVSALVTLGLISAFSYISKRRQIQAFSQLAAGGAQLQVQDLESTEWQVVVTSLDGSQTYTDTLSFKDAKFNSTFFYHRGFPKTNFSVSRYEERIIWETLQTEANNSVSWRGEIEEGKMRGILSLHSSDGKMRDFSFISTGLRRK